MRVRKLAHTLMFWKKAATATLDGETYEVGVEAGSRAIFIIVPGEAWYVVELEEIVKELVAYRLAHKDDLPDDEPKEAEASVGEKAGAGGDGKT